MRGAPAKWGRRPARPERLFMDASPQCSVVWASTTPTSRSPRASNGTGTCWTTQRGISDALCRGHTARVAVVPGHFRSERYRMGLEPVQARVRNARKRHVCAYCKARHAMTVDTFDLVIDPLDELLAEQLRYYSDRAPEYAYERRGRHDHGPDANRRWRADLDQAA